MQQSSSLSSISGFNLQSDLALCISAFFPSSFYFIFLPPVTLQISFFPRFSIRIETRFENNNGSNNNVSVGLNERRKEVKKTEWLKKRGVGGRRERQRGKRGIAIFSAEPQKKNVCQIDVAITRKTSKAQYALLADLLTRCAGCWSFLPCCIPCTANAHKHAQTFTSTSIGSLLLINDVIQESRETRPNMSEFTRSCELRETLMNLVHVIAGVRSFQYLQICNSRSKEANYKNNISRVSIQF